ncbi:hypothetical protein IWQ62_005190 [Dispira parvispora]|uniref:Chromatin target of PRMT1 protein C-terminal domain-containing protein n=1 Tax=Dispira parvispora TaxID=1520584 RepID=A0A9W8AQW8_9FUNG|nr:hypothetical protein IWQ62_005190 [Dispira parvispora]
MKKRSNAAGPTTSQELLNVIAKHIQSNASPSDRTSRRRQQSTKSGKDSVGIVGSSHKTKSTRSSIKKSSPSKSKAGKKASQSRPRPQKKSRKSDDKPKASTKEDLDAQLDNYMLQDGTTAKSKLDNDLDSYMDTAKAE